MYPFHALLQSTSNQHRQCRCQAFTGRIKVAEGVGFEPTVGCPTLDFESSALNRTQPPFHFCEINIHLLDPEKSAFIMRRRRRFANPRGALESATTRSS